MNLIDFTYVDNECKLSPSSFIKISIKISSARSRSPIWSSITNFLFAFSLEVPSSSNLRFLEIVSSPSDIVTQSNQSFYWRITLIRVIYPLTSRDLQIFWSRNNLLILLQTQWDCVGKFTTKFNISLRKSPQNVRESIFVLIHSDSTISSVSTRSRFRSAASCAMFLVSTVLRIALFINLRNKQRDASTKIRIEIKTTLTTSCFQCTLPFNVLVIGSTFRLLLFLIYRGNTNVFIFHGSAFEAQRSQTKIRNSLIYGFDFMNYSELGN